MIRRDETYNGGGVCVRAVVWDTDAGTWSLEVDGVIVDSRPLTAEEIAALTDAGV